MKKKISLAAYLAGVTTLAVSLPAMAERQSDVVLGDNFTMSLDAKATLPRKDETSDF